MTRSDSQTELQLGYRPWAAGRKACLDNIEQHLEIGNGFRWAACLNPHSYAVATRDSRFQQALRCAHWLLPDGAGTIMASFLLGGRIRSRITGFDLFAGVHERLQAMGGRSVFFLGASETTLARIRERMGRDYPGVAVAGTYSPPFRPEFDKADNDAMIEAINGSGACVLWVAMTAPKQEKWLAEQAPRLQVRFAGAVGAVFDFYAGNVRRSPRLFRQLGLEWLPRLLQEPRRLWRRTFVSAPLYMWHVLRERWGTRRS